jgi:hypothetical protein
MAPIVNAIFADAPDEIRHLTPRQAAAHIRGARSGSARKRAGV